MERGAAHPAHSHRDSECMHGLKRDRFEDQHFEGSMHLIPSLAVMKTSSIDCCEEKEKAGRNNFSRALTMKLCRSCPK